MNKFLLIYFIVTSIILISCNDSEKNRIKIASVGNYVLYLDEMQESMPSKLSKKDSLLFSQNYINQWLSSKVLLKKAEENINTDDLKIDKQIEEYRNSLIIYSYQKILIYQKLDTLVSEADIEKYYNEHQNDFLLKNNIVKVAFIKLPREATNTKQVKQMLKEYTPDNSQRLIDFADKFAVNYFIDDQVWLMFDDFIKEVPIKTYNQEMFLKNNTYIELQDSLFQYFVKINGFKVKDAISPLSYEYEKIRSLILNKRKLDLINKMEDDIFKEAQSNGDIKIY